jgi:hypothetical protein
LLKDDSPLADEAMHDEEVEVKVYPNAVEESFDKDTEVTFGESLATGEEEKLRNRSYPFFHHAITNEVQ